VPSFLEAANAAATALALAAAMGLGVVTGPVVPTDRAVENRGGEHWPGVAPEILEDGTRVLRDASGHTVPLVRYERIASLSIVADPLLLELCEPERIVGFSETTLQTKLDAHRFTGKAALSGEASLERLLALKPDLILINDLGAGRRAELLREAGVSVFDLGPMRGLATYLPNVHQLGWLVGRPEQAEQLANRFVGRMKAVAGDVASSDRLRGLYMGIHGSFLYGGTKDTSFHDVLTYAGLQDVAAAEFRGWPDYTSEQLLQLDPEVVVTQTGMRETLCRHTELAVLAACRARGRVVEIEPGIMSDPGARMLQATEAVHDAVYGKPGPQ
jgi:iron complex transport system substrate-binding protein